MTAALDPSSEAGHSGDAPMASAAPQERTSTGRPPLYAADEMMSSFFTYTGEARAQQYLTTSPDTSRGPEESLMAPYRQRERARYAEALSLFAAAPAATRQILRTVYGSGTDAIEVVPSIDAPNARLNDRVGIGADRVGRLRLRMSPTWGHGSYIRMAVAHVLALTAYARRYPVGSPSYHAVLEMLVTEANPPEKSQQAPTRLLANLRDECEAIRDAALKEFDEVLREHAKAARGRAQARRRDEEAATAAARAKADRRRAHGAAIERRPAVLQWSSEKREELRRLALERIEDLKRFSALIGDG